MDFHVDTTDLSPALADLQDAFARAKAQAHVLRLAMSGLRNESDVRALLAQLNAIEEELNISEGFLKLRGQPGT